MGSFFMVKPMIQKMEWNGLTSIEFAMDDDELNEDLVEFGMFTN